VVAMILKASSIRDVIAFPKNRSAYCPLSQAPSFVSESQLKELDLHAPSPEEVSVKPAGRAGSAPAGEGRISLDHVRHIAKLARLKLTAEEAVSYQKDLNSILEYVETLQKLNTESVQPMSHVLPATNVWREDKPGKPDRSKSILANSPMREPDYFKVPRIIEG
jgi:aspartyl/glutamyl-tRNA(Asn/Gln) amidotransferase C subunit